MSHGNATLAPRPSHVPPERVVDFNVYDPPGGSVDLHGAWRSLQDGPDIVWAPYHGGHWIFTRAEDIDFAQRNHDPFSMRDVTMPANTRPTRLLPLEADPPEHTPFRAILNPWFSPKKIGELKDFTRELAVTLIEGFKPRGECEFMHDFALILPIAIFMRLTNLPMDDRLKLLTYAQMSTRGTPEQRGEASRLMMAYLTPVIAERRATARRRPAERGHSRADRRPAAQRHGPDEHAARHPVRRPGHGGLDARFHRELPGPATPRTDVS